MRGRGHDAESQPTQMGADCRGAADFAGVKFWLINTYLTRQHAAPQAISCPDLQAGCTLPGGTRVRFCSPPATASALA